MPEAKFQYPLLVMLPKDHKNAGGRICSLGNLAPAPEAVEIIRYTVYADKCEQGWSTDFLDFSIRHTNDRIKYEVGGGLYSDFLMLDAEGGLVMVKDSDSGDLDAFTQRKGRQMFLQSLAGKIKQYCIDRKIIVPGLKPMEIREVWKDENGNFDSLQYQELSSREHKDDGDEIICFSRRWKQVVIRKEAAEAVIKILQGENAPEGFEHFVRVGSDPILPDMLRVLEESIHKKSIELQKQYDKKVSELHRQLEALRKGHMDEYNSMVEAETSKLKKVFEETGNKVGIAACDTCLIKNLKGKEVFATV